MTDPTNDNFILAEFTELLGILENTDAATQDLQMLLDLAINGLLPQILTSGLANKIQYVAKANDIHAKFIDNKNTLLPAQDQMAFNLHHILTDPEFQNLSDNEADNVNLTQQSFGLLSQLYQQLEAITTTDPEKITDIADIKEKILETTTLLPPTFMARIGQNTPELMGKTPTALLATYQAPKPL